jgi:polysaccharide export outer membrane protein
MGPEDLLQMSDGSMALAGWRELARQSGVASASFRLFWQAFCWGEFTMYRVILALCALLSLAACSSVASPVADYSVARGSDAFARGSYGSYTLRPSDQLRIQVYDDQSISGDYQIDSSGFISIPLAGRIKAGGLTPGQLEHAIESRLGKVLKKPGVNVQITSYGSLFVHGEVKRAGDFSFKPGLTVMDAIAMAGGYTYRADESQVVVIRAGSNVESVYPMSHRIPVYPGDNIRIPERFF